MSKSHRDISDLPPIDTDHLQLRIKDDVDNVDAGVGLRHVEHNLLLHMDRPDSTPLGTVFRLFWGNTGVAVATKILLPGDENLKRIPFIVPSDYVREPFAHPVYVHVQRPSGNQSETQPLRLRVNLKRPGGQDLNPVPGNQKLLFELPIDLIINGLGDERAKQGVEVTFRYWEHMAAYDCIFLVWGNQQLTRRIEPFEVGFDVCIKVDYETILLAGSSETMPIAYRVEGPTGNKNDPWAPWSQVFYLPVYLDDDLLLAPWLNFPETEGYLDLTDLGDNDAMIGLYVGSSDAQLYNTVFLVWSGFDAENESIPYISHQELTMGRAYYFTIENMLVKAIAKGRAVVHYFLAGNGLPDRKSYRLHLEIRGDVIGWPAPTFDEADGVILDPNLILATVRFPAQISWGSTDRLCITLLASEMDAIEYIDCRPVGQIPPGEDVTFEVPGIEIMRFEGRTISLYYSVQRGTSPARESLYSEWKVAGQLLRDYTDFDNYNWNGWVNAVSVRGELVIDGFENICWRATKNSGEFIALGIEKVYMALKLGAKYELEFYYKSSGGGAELRVVTEFGGEVNSVAGAANRNWEKISRVFITPESSDISVKVKISFVISAAHTFFIDQVKLRELPEIT